MPSLTTLLSRLFYTLCPCLPVPRYTGVRFRGWKGHSQGCTGVHRSEIPWVERTLTRKHWAEGRTARADGWCSGHSTMPRGSARWISKRVSKYQVRWCKDWELSSGTQGRLKRSRDSGKHEKSWRSVTSRARGLVWMKAVFLRGSAPMLRGTIYRCSIKYSEFHAYEPSKMRTCVRMSVGVGSHGWCASPQRASLPGGCLLCTSLSSTV